MPSVRSSLPAFGLALILALLAGCGGRPGPLLPRAHLLSATLPQLAADFNRNADAIHSLSLKLQLNARAGKHKYPGVTAFLLTRKPSDIRLWGNLTLVGRIFDMASNGTRFELSLPAASPPRFIEGLNDVVPEKVKNPLEKIRPQVILNALLINPIATTQRVALDPNSQSAAYEIIVLQPGEDGFERLVRLITISRYDLLPSRQVIYDRDGIHTTIATYSKYTLRQGIPIPLDMTITRPVEGYTLRLKLDGKGIAVNVPFPQPNTFTLTPPAGSTVVKISRNSGSPPSPVGNGSPRR